MMIIKIIKTHSERVPNRAKTRDTAFDSTTTAVTAPDSTATTLHSKAQGMPKCPAGTILGFRV